MRTKTISRNPEVLYENVDEFRNFYPEKKLSSSWRDAHEGEWVVTDDLQVCKILRRSTMKTSAGKEVLIYVYFQQININMLKRQLVDC